MPDPDVSLSTWPDVGRLREHEMVAIQTGSSNNFGAKREKQREFNVGSAKYKSGIVENVG